jgi:hypothetical protein
MDAKLILTTLMAQNFDVFYFVDDMLYVLYFSTGQCFDDWKFKNFNRKEFCR